MAPTILYSATVLGMLCLYLVLRPGGRQVRIGAGVLGLATLAWLLVRIAATFTGDGASFGPFSYIFSAIAIAAAARMISHPRPVFAALYFVLVVISSAGLFLMLEAEFMTFALVIVYAGAILITYLFVLMLAHQAPVPEAEGEVEVYDRVPREPGAAALVGFILLALLSTAILSGRNVPGGAPSVLERVTPAWRQLERMPLQFRASVLAAHSDFAWPPAAQADGTSIVVDPVSGVARIEGHLVGSSRQEWFELGDDLLPENIQQVGWALVHDFPASLELAGVILLMAMFGAVVLARRQIELSEDEKREAAGLRRIAVDADGDLVSGGGA
ncbi:MAG: NADH-quinone oxidoreductase subunit J [Phycisphaerales bacterium]|nr:NADH-quinone oxidoreductase subunit J [Phycisphaerales bacterium]